MLGRTETMHGHSPRFLAEAPKAFLQSQPEFVANLCESLLENPENTGIEVSFDSENGFLNVKKGKAVLAKDISVPIDHNCPFKRRKYKLKNIILLLLGQPHNRIRFDAGFIEKISDDRRKLNQDVARASSGRVWGIIGSIQKKHLLWLAGERGAVKTPPGHIVQLTNLDGVKQELQSWRNKWQGERRLGH